MKTRFTVHAFERVQERLRLDDGQVAEILDQDLCVLIGKDGESSRVHKLFYSKVDEGWFVAVQDDSTGEVVTILPVIYHNR